MPAQKSKPVMDISVFAADFFRSEHFAEKPNRLIHAEGVVVRRDPLTEIQQRIVTSAIGFIRAAGDTAPIRSLAMDVIRFLQVSGLEIHNKELPKFVTLEMEKLLKKGVWLYDEKRVTLTRAVWFQSVEYSAEEITFQFSDRILPLIYLLVPDETEHSFIKGLQYKGKHTLAVYNIIRFWQGKGLVEYTIPELMQQLFLEHTRYSYGQLRLRVLEPAFEEIYAWDDAVFVRFGPTFSGRRVEGVWFEVTVGDEARALRRLEPEFKLATPDQKPPPPPADLKRTPD